MVSHSHLSAGNSISSPSRDLFAEFGVSKPSLPSSPASVHSDEASVNGSLEVSDTPSHASMQDIFRAAQHFSQSDRLEVVAERKKSLDLENFISAKGFSLRDVDNFLHRGSSCRKVNEHDVFVLGPKSQSVCEPPSQAGICSDSSGHLALPSSYGPSCLAPTARVIEVLDGETSPAPEVPCAAGLDPSEKALPMPWNEVVSGGLPKPTCSLSFHPPSLVDGAVMIKPPKTILQKGNSQWNTSLVGYFLHSRLPFKVVEATAFKLWGKYGLQNVFLLDKGFFIFKFPNSSARDNVLALGPWYFANKLLSLKCWKEGIDFQSGECSKVPVWVKFHHIPLSYWTAEGLSYLASGIGRPLFADKQTERLDPLSFARVCIEIDVNSVLHDRLMVTVFDEEAGCENTLEVKVEFQSIPPSCSTCKVFGHSLFKCPRANFQSFGS